MPPPCSQRLSFRSPSFSCLQVFVALLQAHQPDLKRHLVRESLDILTPHMAARITRANQGRFPIWIRYLKKVPTPSPSRL